MASKGTSGKLANTTFETKPDNKLAVVDVYENSSSGIENSFQDAYHKTNSAIDSFASIGSSSLSSVNGVLNSITSQANKFNNILNGIRSGNLNSLFNLTGGASSGLKQLNDTLRSVYGTVNNATNLVNNLSNMGNTLKGGLNNNGYLNRLMGNIPLGRQIQDIIRTAGTINSATDSLERSMGRASNILGGDRSSMNSAYYGNFNKADSITTPTRFDSANTTQATQEMLNKFNNISPDISSAVGSLPEATRQALLRGFTDESLSTGVITASGSTATRLSPQVSADVIQPLNNIINSFTNTTTSEIPTQDPSAVAALISGVTNIASSAGMRDTFTTITRDIDNNDVLVSAAKPLITRAIEQGDLDTVIDLSKSKINKDISKFSPNLVESITYNVQRPSEMSQQEFAPYYEDVKTAFQTINPKWDTYTLPNGFYLVNGCSISSNAFLCDLIEACLNERNNTRLNDSNRQVIGSPILPKDSIIKTDTETIKDTFSDELEKEIDKINKDSFNESAEEGETIITPPDTPDPVDPTPPVEEPIELVYDNEPFLLLASVYIDNSVQSEIEKHFPYLNERFKIMGTYERG